LRQLELCEGRLCFELVSGEGPRRGWVSLHAAGRELVRRRREPEEGATEPLLNTDYMGTLRGACRGCQSCNLWRFTSLSSIEWGGPDTTTTIDDRRHAYDRKMRGYQEKRRGFSARCQNCLCPAEEHLDLSGWLDAVQKAARPFRETYEEAIRKDPAYRHLGRAIGSAKTRTLPRHATIPAAALDWPVSDAAIYLLSLGFFDPRLHGRTGEGDQALRKAPGKHLVSVVCPTSEKRHGFHPLLYENFRTQSYEPKELIVVDTGSRPSPFLLDKVQSDPRVIYRHFTVDDSRDTDPMSAVLVDDGLSLVTAEDVKRRRGICFKPKTGWSLGFKRNLCGHLARGVVIAHFDDDDLYAPDYLSRMVEALFSAFGGQLVVAPGLKAAATLSEWHMMEVKEQQFGFFDPKTDPLVEGPMRESFQYGYGFSLVYTKSAWETVPFPDVEWSEDGEFMGRLQLQKIPIQLVCSRDCYDGLAAHTHHSDSTSGGEMCGNVRLGYAVPVPSAFRALLPVARKVALDANVRRGSQHPLRAEMHRVLDGFGQAPSEVRWHEKELFLKRNPDFGQRPPATPQYKEWSGQVRGGFGFGLSYRGPWLRAVMFTCCGRRSQFFGEDFLDLSQFKVAFPRKPLLGLWANGEIGPQAMASAAPEEATRTGRAALQGFTAVFGVFRAPLPSVRRAAALPDDALPLEVGRWLSGRGDEARKQGDIFLKEGDVAAAALNYARAQALSDVPTAEVPRSDRCHIRCQLSSVELKAGRFDKALAYADEALSTEEDNLEARCRRAEAMLSMGRAEEVVRDLKASTCAAPDLTALLEQAEHQVQAART
ncbi:unnamed protein product, partial [Symbiodinium sp. CCMP2456]